VRACLVFLNLPLWQKKTNSVHRAKAKPLAFYWLSRPTEEYLLLLPWRKNKQRARLGVVSRLSDINFRSNVAARKHFHWLNTSLVLGFRASSPCASSPPDYTFIPPRRKKGGMNILATRKPFHWLNTSLFLGFRASSPV